MAEVKFQFEFEIQFNLDIFFSLFLCIHTGFGITSCLVRANEKFNLTGGCLNILKGWIFCMCFELYLMWTRIFIFSGVKKMHECQTGFDKNTSLLISFFPYLKEMLVYYGDRNIINVMSERAKLWNGWETNERIGCIYRLGWWKWKWGKNQNSFWSSDSRLKLRRILCQWNIEVHVKVFFFNTIYLK